MGHAFPSDGVLGHLSLNLPQASRMLGTFQYSLDTGRDNCRSLGFARDDKGDGSAPIEGSGASDFVDPSTCRRQVGCS
jgi:hypothetical protein